MAVLQREVWRGPAAVVDAAAECCTELGGLAAQSSGGLEGAVLAAGAGGAGEPLSRRAKLAGRKYRPSEAAAAAVGVKGCQGAASADQ